ncbi:MAG TPA: glycosyltransferase family 4 protein [Steroidobacteraceae bacterium]|nr:glycosyltransferase family 4 protein [Steroidobacteraceae bacterium]
MKPRVLIFTSYYLPGYRAGGPIKSVAAAVEALHDKYQIAIVTRDREVGERRPYEVARNGQTARYGGVPVHYVPPNASCILQIRDLVRRYDPDLIYLNSLFDPVVTTVPLLLRRCGLVARDIGVALAPRGEFSQGALSLKRLRKRAFLTFAKGIDLYRGVIWQATAEKEVPEIRGAIAPTAPVIVVVPDPPATPQLGASNTRPAKSLSALRLIFLGRISRMKNLDGALRILRNVRQRVQFSIYGPTEDEDYWKQCQELIAQLPDNVSVSYLGAVEPHQVSEAFFQNDLLFLPTLGENFGHVICEAWACGCPVLISDRTPWRELEGKGVGWDVPLNQPEVFARIIDRCAQLDPSEFELLRRKAHTHAQELRTLGAASNSLNELFSRALTHHAWAQC